jgi:DNA-binding response OmpR family regulator
MREPLDMKQVLIIDESPLFREYLKVKFTENDIGVIIGINAMDGVSKMRNSTVDLIIVDYDLTGKGIDYVLNQKKTDLNIAQIPIIILANHIDQRRLIQLVPFNVKKVFAKPVKIDALFATLEQLLDVEFSIDLSSGIVEVHVNDGVIFIEISQGLNRDKLDLLYFKIIELINLYEIIAPRIIVMLSNIHLNYGDGPNLEKLLQTITKASHARMRDIKLLTLDSFARQYVSAQKEYIGLEVVSNLQLALNGLLSGPIPGGEATPELIGDKLLQGSRNTGANDAMALQFTDESARLSAQNIKLTVNGRTIALIDDDLVIQNMIKNAFEKNGAIVRIFSNGSEFLNTIDTEDYDLAFLDLRMPVMDGIETLKVLQTRAISYPIVVLTAVTSRETVIQTFKMGVKSYLVKPLHPDDIYKKAMEILRTNF